MSDYISREWLSNAIHNFFNGLNHNVTEEDIQAYINAVPSADVRENVHGEWIEVTDYKDDNVHRWHIICSVCRHRGMFGDDNFCPNCGADMRGKENA